MSAGGSYYPVLSGQAWLDGFKSWANDVQRMPAPLFPECVDAWFRLGGRVYEWFYRGRESEMVPRVRDQKAGQPRQPCEYSPLC